MKVLLPVVFLCFVFGAIPQAQEARDKTASPSASRDSTLLPPEAFQAPKTNLTAYALGVGLWLVPVAIAYPMLNKDNPTDREDLIGWPLLFSGLFIGPSAGQFYAGSWAKGFAHLGVRLGGLGLAGYGASVEFSDCFNHEDCASDEANLFYALGLGVYGAGVLYSLIDTHRAVDRANERARKRFESRMSLSPALLPVGKGSFAPGLALRATF